MFFILLISENGQNLYNLWQGSNPSSPTTCQTLFQNKVYKIKENLQNMDLQVFLFPPAYSKFSKMPKIFVAKSWQF